jgi:AraC family transcriptional regulator
MEWSERMNLAIDYIEKNLGGEIDINEVARIAHCSTYHFQRMFFAIIGISLADYIRRRRLTLAASELSSSDIQVIDVALKYGYDSPNAFTRAFRNVHGINPRAARAPGTKLTAFPRVSFHIELKGGNDMDYKIIEKPAFDVVGKGKEFTLVNGENLIKIPQFINEFMKSKKFIELGDSIGWGPGPITGSPFLAINIPKDYKFLNFDAWDPFVYAFGFEKTDKMKTAGFQIFHIPAATWAIFECTGKTLDETRKRVFTEWFPSTEYQHDTAPTIELLWPERNNIHHAQLWYPVIKKN